MGKRHNISQRGSKLNRADFLPLIECEASAIDRNNAHERIAIDRSFHLLQPTPPLRSIWPNVPVAANDQVPLCALLVVDLDIVALTSFDLDDAGNPQGALNCDAAIDVNNDGSHDIGDVVHFVQGVFAGSVAIPAPNPGTGPAVVDVDDPLSPISSILGCDNGELCGP